MVDDLNPTTRKYPRTLEEAFPKDPENAKWLYTDEYKSYKWADVLSVVIVIAWAMVLYYLVCLAEMKGSP
jgi:uncharacterized membrane protein YkgB